MSSLAIKELHHDNGTSADYVGEPSRSNIADLTNIINPFGSWSFPTTASSYGLRRREERTTTGSFSEIHQHGGTSSAEAVLEIRRRSGLAWEQLAILFHVSKRNVCRWASGKSPSSQHTEEIIQILAAIRHIDTGSQSSTRQRLLGLDAVGGESLFELLLSRRFGEFMSRAPKTHRVERNRMVSLTPEALNAFRIQSPMLLLDAIQERPDVLPDARIGHAVSTTK